MGIHSNFDVSGKNNEYFNMNLFIASPILNSFAGTSSTNCIACYGVKCHKQISNHVDKNEKVERHQKFANFIHSDFR